MKIKCTTILVFLFVQFIYSQCDIEPINFYKHHKIESQKDTIQYHSFSTAPLSTVKNVLLYIHGSGAKPLFEIKRDSFGYSIFSSVPFDMNVFDKDLALVLVSKKDIPFCIENQDEFKAPISYLENETLDYRVYQNEEVIKDIKKRTPSLEKLIVLGHSEGSDVAAKLCATNTSVTHLGYWSGGGNSQFYDFPLFVSKEISSGKITQEEGLNQYDALLAQYKEMLIEKDSIQKEWYGNSYKRWAYFSQSPIESLVKIDIPIFLAMGVSDQAVPFESAMLIPVEFVRLGKDNLTHHFYPNLDHSFNEYTEEGKPIPHWDEIFLEFLEWVQNN